MPVAGPAYYPWGKPHGHPYGPHPMGEVGNVLIKGCTALGIRVSAGGPVAILSASHGDRPHCIYRGFCIQGCKVGAKASTLVTHVPDAICARRRNPRQLHGSSCLHQRRWPRQRHRLLRRTRAASTSSALVPSSCAATRLRRLAFSSIPRVPATNKASPTPPERSANTSWRRPETSSWGNLTI